jgi:hypothetical protein
MESQMFRPNLLTGMKTVCLPDRCHERPIWTILLPIGLDPVQPTARAGAKAPPDCRGLALARRAMQLPPHLPSGPRCSGRQDSQSRTCSAPIPPLHPYCCLPTMRSGSESPAHARGAEGRCSLGSGTILDLSSP